MNLTITNIAFVDDLPEQREKIASAIKQTKQFKTLITATGGRDLLLQLILAKQLPHLILMDIQMPCCDGVLTTSICKRLFPNIKIVGISSHTSPEVISEFIAEGGNGFFSKFIVQKNSGLYKQSMVDEDFFENALIKILNENAIYFDPLTAYIPEDYNIKLSTKKIIAKNFSFLSNNEIIYLQLNAAGFTQKEMSQILYVEVPTIKKYQEKMCKTFNAKSHTDLISVSLSVGIVKMAKFYQTY